MRRPTPHPSIIVSRHHNYEALHIFPIFAKPKRLLVVGIETIHLELVLCHILWLYGYTSEDATLNRKPRHADQGT